MANASIDFRKNTIGLFTEKYNKCFSSCLFSYWSSQWNLFSFTPIYELSKYFLL